MGTWENLWQSFLQKPSFHITPCSFSVERGVLAWTEQLLIFGGKWGPVFVQRSCMSRFTLTLMMFERKHQTQRKARLAWGLGQSSCWYLLVLVSESESSWAWLSTCMMRPGDGKKGEKVEMFQLPPLHARPSSHLHLQHLKRGSSTNLTPVQICLKRKIFTLEFRCSREKY